MSYNFYFISGKNPASTNQALQQAPKAEPRPRPVLQLTDQPHQEFPPLTADNIRARAPDPRPQNQGILNQRATSVGDDPSIRSRASRSRRSRSYRSRSPLKDPTQVTGHIVGPVTPPPVEIPPGQWAQDIPGVWNQYGNLPTASSALITPPQVGHPPAVMVPQPRPPGFPHCTFRPRMNPRGSHRPQSAPPALPPFSAF